jgi:GAF domain-containing protein
MTLVSIRGGMNPQENRGRRGEGHDRSGAVLDRIGDPVFGVDDESRVTYANDQALSLFREASRETLDESGVLGTDIEAYGWLAETSLGEIVTGALGGSEPISFEEHYQPIDSWLAGRAYPGESGVSVCIHEVTAETDRHEALRGRMELMRDIYEVMAARDRSFEERVAALLDIGAAELGIEYGTLTNVRGEREYVFDVVRSPDLPIEPGYSIPLEEVYCERTVLDRETLVLADVTRDAPEFTDRAVHTMLGMVSYVGTPIVVEDEVYGSFCLCDTEPREDGFSAWEVLVVEMMGKWISYALERQRTERRLTHQNARLEQFASLLSHDLQTPLSVARGTLEMVDTSDDDDDHVQRIDRAHERMSELIADSIEMARQGDPVEDRSPLDLSVVGERAWTTVETADATLEAEETVVYAEESRLHRLLENCYRNAIDHGGPDVTVSIGDLDDHDGFYVEDDGPGISPEDRGKVLEFGYSTDEDGTGFGLSIVNQIAEAHGWSVQVCGSSVGGARFEFVRREGTA